MKQKGNIVSEMLDCMFRITTELEPYSNPYRKTSKYRDNLITEELDRLNRLWEELKENL